MLQVSQFLLLLVLVILIAPVCKDSLYMRTQTSSGCIDSNFSRQHEASRECASAPLLSMYSAESERGRLQAWKRMCTWRCRRSKIVSPFGLHRWHHGTSNPCALQSFFAPRPCVGAGEGRQEFIPVKWEQMCEKVGPEPPKDGSEGGVRIGSAETMVPIVMAHVIVKSKGGFHSWHPKL